MRKPADDNEPSGGVLGEREIRKRMKVSAERLEALVITPLAKNAIDTDSIDIRLGTRFLVPYPYQIGSVPYKRKLDAAEFQRLVHVPRGKSLVVPVHSTVLGSVYEYIKLPYDVSGQILTKSSLARLFVTIEGAPWVHPLYRGCLTLEIANASGTPIELQPLDRIGQLVLFKVLDPIKPPTDRIEGRYIGPTAPEIPGS